MISELVGRLLDRGADERREILAAEALARSVEGDVPHDVARELVADMSSLEQAILIHTDLTEGSA